MNKQKILFSLLMIILSIFVIALFWRIPLFLCLLFVALAFFKHHFYPIKSELLWFMLIGFIGAGGESAIMSLSGAWAYSSSQIFNIPIWLPLLWGFAGTTVIILYEGVTGK